MALRRTASRWPDALAVTEPDARASYRELLDEAECVAAGMQALGVRRGDHVGLLMVNGLTACQVLFGCWLLGAVAVPMNSRYKASELRQVIAHADITCLFIADSLKDHVDHTEPLQATFPDLSQADDPQALALGLAP